MSRRPTLSASLPAILLDNIVHRLLNRPIEERNASDSSSVSFASFLGKQDLEVLRDYLAVYSKKELL